MTKFTFTGSKWNNHFATTMLESMKMICGLDNLFSLSFLDLDKYYRNFPDDSNFSLTFPKYGLFSRPSRFSTFSICVLSPAKILYPLKAYLPSATTRQAEEIQSSLQE